MAVVSEIEAGGETRKIKDRVTRLDWGHAATPFSVVVSQTTLTNLYTATAKCRLYVTLDPGQPQSVIDRLNEIAVNNHTVYQVNPTSSYPGMVALPSFDLGVDDVFQARKAGNTDNTFTIYVVPYN